MEVQSNDERSFRIVYEEVFPILMRVVYHVVHNVDIAEEICQEAFIRFFDKAMTFPSLNDAKYWLIRVAKNLAINVVKRSSRERSMVEKLKQFPTPHANTTDGEKILMKEETRQEVQQAIENLPEKYRLVIVLREYSDMDYKQIAKVLNISESNVKVRVYRARKMLESTLNQE
ncbi:MAG TPA: RNA polymerase sigma factor [Sphaerochaeta sp.]|nr:RNA polymerase sigma factor [Sphaerochaeta sp.]